MTDPRLFVPTAPPVPASKSPSVQRFTLRYGVMICQTCNLASAYCTCARQPSVSADADRDTADLDRRAKECKGR